MIGFEFLNNRTRFIHSKDLDDMRTAVLDDDDQEIGDDVSDYFS